MQQSCSGKGRYSVGKAFFEELCGMAARSPLGVSVAVLANHFKSAEKRMAEADGDAGAGAIFERRRLICAFSSDVPLSAELITGAASIAWGNSWCVKLGRPGFRAAEPLEETISPRELGRMLASRIGESFREGPIPASPDSPVNSRGSKSSN